MPTIYRRTSVRDAEGNDHIFEPGDNVPDDIAAIIDNPTVWERPEERSEDPLGTVSTEPERGPAIADAPYATSPEGDGVVTPPAGPTPETMKGLPADGSSAEAPTVISRPSPAQLDGMTRAQLDEVALSLGLDPTEYGTKSEVRSAIDSAAGPDETGDDL